MFGGYVHATKILDQLPDDKKSACLRALKNAEQGQAKLSSKDWNSALTLCKAAHEGFSKIPEARNLLGVAKCDIAAAYGNLGNTSKAKKFAKESLSIVRGVEYLSYTEAMAHMTIGIAYYMDNDSDQGSRHFGISRQLLNRLPEAKGQLQLLDSNERQLKSIQGQKKRKWWHLW